MNTFSSSYYSLVLFIYDDCPDNETRKQFIQVQEKQVKEKQFIQVQEKQVKEKQFLYKKKEAVISQSGVLLGSIADNILSCTVCTILTCERSCV